MLDFGGASSATEAVAVHLPKWPLDLVERVVTDLIHRGVVVLGDRALVWPRYLEAQETTASGAQRTREWRERRRDVNSLNKSLNKVVQPLYGDETSQISDETSPDVTKRLQSVTSGDSVPSVPCRAEPAEERNSRKHRARSSLLPDRLRSAIEGTALAHFADKPVPTAWLAHVDRLEREYPRFDAAEDLRRCVTYLTGNPHKTPKKYLTRYLSKWFNRTIDRGRQNGWPPARVFANKEPNE